MYRPAQEPREPPPGYTLLLGVDPQSGRNNGTETLLVPLALGETLNAARRVLYNLNGRADAWTRAGAVRLVLPPVPEDGHPDPADTAPQHSSRDRPPGIPTVPARPAASPPAVDSTSRKRQRTSTGHRVPVIAADQILARRRSVEQRVKLTAEEKKTELKFMDDLLARGPTRLVGLKPDWPARIARMRTDMPNLSKVIDRIESCCALSTFARRPLRIPPMLLVGPPGVGKTRFAIGLADLLGTPSFVYALESAETVSVLTGTEKHWWTAEPGQLFQLIVQTDFANPVVVLDELNKISTGNHYKPSNALHAVLEPTTARQLRDKCLDLTFDASYSVFVATANRLSGIEDSLLSRFELFHVQAPLPCEAVAIARAVGREVLEELKLTRRFEAPAGEVVQQLALLGSPRRMHKVLLAAIGRAVLNRRNRVQVDDLLDQSADPRDDAGQRATH